MMQLLRCARPRASCLAALALAWLTGCEDEARLVFPAGPEESVAPALPSPAAESEPPVMPAPGSTQSQPAPLDMATGAPGASSEPPPVAPGEAPVEPEAPPPAQTNPLYAVMFEVFDDTGSNSYLSLL